MQAKPAAAEATRLRARENLLLIYDFIGVDTERTNPHLQYGACVLLEGPYLILYETHPDTDEIEIVRVVYGCRDLTRPF